MSELIKNIAGAGGGGGCFRAGTQVQLEGGNTIAIELLKEGDSVLAFDEEGKLHSAKVTKVHYHEDPQPILEVDYWRGKMRGITPNHWVQNQYENFVEMGQLSTHDALVDGMGHLRPIIGAKLVGHEPVWNLTVEPHHTFIADGIRVHNGGHRDRFPTIAGAGGGGGSKGGGGGRAAVEDTDSLRSRAMVTLLDLLGEGQIGGLVSGAQSIFLDSTPLQNADGTYNFTNVSWDSRVGTQDQTYIPLINDIESPVNDSVQIKKDTPHVFTISNPNATSVRVIMSVPSLISQDMTTGDVHGTSVSYKFSVSTDGGQFSPVAAGSSGFIDANATKVSLSGYELTAISGDISGVGGAITITSTKGCASYNEYDGSGELHTYHYGYATIKAQYYNGSTWIDTGDQFTLEADTTVWGGSGIGGRSFWGWEPTVRRYSGSSVQTVNASSFVSTKYLEYSGKNKIRFVVLSSTPGIAVGVTHTTYNHSILDCVISGKVRSKYEVSHLFALPKPGSNYSIKIERTTPDSTSSSLQNDLWIDSYVEIVDSKLTYPNSALVAIKVDSAQFKSLPQRSYLVDGLLIRVPSNYNKATNTYVGIWNGTFQTIVSDNPAWVLFDLLTNKRYGLGDFISESQIDKSKLYVIGKYCDELVPNGFGGMEKRFAINTQISSQKDAYRLISDISSTFRGMTYWAGGMTGFTQDSPADSGMIYSQANVIDGLFNYAGSSRKDRHSVVLVTYNDVNDRYKQKVEYIEDSELVAKYGVRKLETIAFGCTSRGQAARVGRWILYTEKSETDVISFKVGVDSSLVMPGEIIRISDADRAGKRMAGRLIGVTSTSATLDAPVTLVAAGAKIAMRLDDGSFVERVVTDGPGDHVVLNWTSALPSLPVANAMFVVTDINLTPVLARVIGVTDEGNNTFGISALEHNPGKYASVENGLALTTMKTSVIGGTPKVPTNLSISDDIYKSGSSILTMLNISWTDSQSGIAQWIVDIRRGNDNWVTYKTSSSHLEVPNVSDGATYYVRVSAQNILGNVSTSLSGSHLVVGKALPPSDVSSVVPYFDGVGVSAQWGQVSDIDIQAYEVRVGNAASVWETATVVRQLLSDRCSIGNLAVGVTKVFVKALDTSGNYSTNAAVQQITVSAPVAPATITGTLSGTTYTLKWDAVSTDQQLDGYDIEIDGTVVTRIKSLSYATPASWVGSKTFKVRAVDVAGNLGSYITHTRTISAPAAATGLSVEFTNDEYALTWSDSASEIAIASYEVRCGGTAWGVGDTYLGTVSALVFKGKANWIGSRTFRIKAKSATGAVGSEATVSSTISLPSTPVISFANYIGQSAKMTWQDCKTTLPIVSYQVLSDSASPFNFSEALNVGVVNANMIQYMIDSVGTRRLYVTATDSAGNTGSAGYYDLTVNAPSAPVVSSVVAQADGTFVAKWNAPASSLPIETYEIRVGATLGTAISLGYVNALTFTSKINWSGAQNVYVAAIDASDNLGTFSTGYQLNVSVPTITGFNNTIKDTQAVLDWTVTVGTLPIDYYEVTYGAGRTSVSKVYSNKLSVPISWTGSRDFYLKAYDIAGNASAESTVNVTVSAPAAVTFTPAPSFLADLLVLNWSVPASTLAILDYEVRYSAVSETNFNNATSVGRINGTVFQTSAQWSGTRRWWVVGRDLNGNVGTAAYSDITISVAAAPTITQQVVDNNVLLYWTQVKGTLPTDTYEFRRGSTWAGATVVGRKSGGFTTVFETVAGNYTYWICAIDTAGNYGTPGQVTATVNQPPDYVLKANITSTFSGTFVNAAADSDGKYMMPVNTTETFATHFSGRSWTTPQSQIDAGYPIYAQPALVGTATYTELIDYGALLASSKVTLTVSGAAVSGSPTVSTSILVSSDNVTYTTYSGVTEVFATNFRYIKVVISVTAATGADLYKLASLSVRLDSKLRNDAGMGTSAATDAVTGNNAVINGVTINGSNPTINGVRVPDGAGTLVTFAQPFVDVSSLDISLAAGSSAKYALYDFVDAPNATGFKVLLYDASGTRVAGSFSWSAKGY